MLIPACTRGVAVYIGSLDDRHCLVNVPMLDVDRFKSDPDRLHWQDWGTRFGYEIPDDQRGLQEVRGGPGNPSRFRPFGKCSSTLVKTLARAFRWKRMLASGEFATIAKLADREGIASPYLPADRSRSPEKAKPSSLR